jgi:hypothetical protein
MAREEHLAKLYKAKKRIQNPDKPLTERQMAFARFLAQGENYRTAYKKAGYTGSAHTATEMLRHAGVMKYLHEEQAKYEEQSKMTKQRVMDGLLESIEMAKLMAEPNAMVKGWSEIGKMCGYYEPIVHRVQVTNNNPLLERLQQMTDAELLAAIQADQPHLALGSDGAGELVNSPDTGAA